ncbi:MAG: hypothetical protein IJ481_03385 [Alphaproteobacteria bacterium]|nr:hypothetical protein [Alphaproteobacteria bacterium]
MNKFLTLNKKNNNSPITQKKQKTILNFSRQITNIIDNLAKDKLSQHSFNRFPSTFEDDLK